MTTQPERLHHLLDRARRGVILPAEGEQLAELVGELGAAIEQADLDAEQQARHFRTICNERESYRQAWKHEQKLRAAAEATVARVRRAVDAGPVGSCCAHLIHAALQPPTTPAEHCGNQKPLFTEHTQRTECVLRPRHTGSHADEHGTRWWWIDNARTTP